MLRNLWALSEEIDSLWVKWVHTYVIKNKSLWHMTLPIEASSIVKEKI